MAKPRFLRALVAVAAPAAPFFERDFGDEVAHRPNRRLGFFLRGGVDDVSDLLTRGVHRLELISRH